MIPKSISAIHYDKPKTFVGIMTFAFTFLLMQGHFVSALGIAGVYIFRYFRDTKQDELHYLFAALVFGALAYDLGYYPIIAGVLAAVITKLLRKDQFLFWFEVAGGAGFIYLSLAEKLTNII